MSLLLEKWGRVWQAKGTEVQMRCGLEEPNGIGGDEKEDVVGEGPGWKEPSEEVLRELVSQLLVLGQFLGFQAGCVIRCMFESRGQRLPPLLI